ncbi:hypothetical protein GCWU000342_00770 [Shuttleworthella satelles DSM 14600]|uniref:Uncharacterized protein n=1 Tax=Shuttleworthella satelles DSM 14600 TaxID=626523 RepID=C4G9W5_9FIRM|nr:hypothetical protein GCWU000342_00770 [Shuttleworthia satelles DSM 14600]
MSYCLFSVLYFNFLFLFELPVPTDYRLAEIYFQHYFHVFT